MSKRKSKARRGKFGEVLEQFVADIADGYVREFKDSPDVARQRADFAMSVIQRSAPGSGIYINKGHLWYVDETHRRIYDRFNGANHAQLAREFNLTERQIYNIIAAVGEEEFQRRQPGLFEQTA